MWVAALRERVQSTAALLDLVFEHAPVGLALLDAHVRYVRVNDRLAEINGVPAAEHAGRTVGELLPDLPADVQADVEHVARTGDAAERRRTSAAARPRSRAPSASSRRRTGPCAGPATRS